MTKRLGNVPEIGPLLEHSTGERVAKQMCCDVHGALDVPFAKARRTIWPMLAGPASGTRGA